MKLISVLVAAFKAEQWLQDSIHSIKTQQLPAGWSLEILIGVDGCGKTLDLAKPMKNKQCRVISMTKNCGTYITFNTLMNYAQGDLICRFDADDVMRSAYIYQLINCLEQGADMAMSWSIYTDAELHPTSYVMAHTYNHPKGGLNKRGSEGQFVIKRSVWDLLGGFRSWVCGADTDFKKRAQSAGCDIRVVEKFLYYRRTHRGSLTAHPKTNFESKLRKQIDARAAILAQSYKNGEHPLMIEALTGTVDVIY